MQVPKPMRRQLFFKVYAYIYVKQIGDKMIIKVS